MNPLILTQTRWGLYDSTPQACDIRAALDGKDDWEEAYAAHGHGEYIENVHAVARYCRETDVSPATALAAATWRIR